MREETLFSMKVPYREEICIKGFVFGKGEKSACIVGAIRGNEYQQLYVCSQLVQALQALEEKGALASNKEILVVPCVNSHSMNIGKRFWPVDNTDINRMFPGNSQGETTQRIAAGIFEKIQNYSYGIQLASFYLPGDFIPHVRMMETGYQSASLANLFGLPYVVLRKPRPIDTTTLNYNWQIWNTNAFSLYTAETDELDQESAGQAVAAILRFLTRMGIIRYHSHSGYIAEIISEDELAVVRTDAGGIYRRKCRPGDEVHYGDILAEIVHPLDGHVIVQAAAPTDGIIFFAHKKPLVTEHEVIYKIIRRLHK